MRTPVPFDTHAYVKQLTAAGVPEPQAEVHARALATLVNDQIATKHDLEELRIATKHDLEELRIATKHDLEELETRLAHEMEKLRLGNQRDLRDLELRLTVRLGVVIAAAIGIVAGIVKLL